MKQEGRYPLGPSRPHTGLPVGLASGGMARIPFLAILLGREVRRAPQMHSRVPLSAVAGWGAKPSGRRACELAARLGVPVLFLEDGFLRSFGTGDDFPPVSLVIDDVGIYYDSTRPSALENLLNSDWDFCDQREEVARARKLVVGYRLSKYNHGLPLRPDTLRPGDVRRVLVVDQTVGDLSVSLGGAGAETFEVMLAAARTENPGATIYVKTHPEANSGRKGGYLISTETDESTVVLREPVNPLSLIEQMDRVYVVSSTMGFEALLAGKPVTCFGIPWYAGWGSTDDRQACTRRRRVRSVDELFAAAYFHYTRHLDPTRRRQGTIFDTIAWLARQREMAGRLIAADGGGVRRRLICVGFRRWKAAQLKPLLSLDSSQVVFVSSAHKARMLHPCSADRLVYWGATPPPGVAELAQACGATTVRVEDGFIRSVGLGSDLIRPLSLVLDDLGIYFDPSRPSGLEELLNTQSFTDEEIERAREVRAFIIEHGITKYNLEPRLPVHWPSAGRRRVLVPGQVEDDASIRLGCGTIRTNLALLAAVRESCPDAFIVYKPHPDVTSGNRKGQVALAQARVYADHVETELSVVSCIEGSDEVHTMTSLTGFDALVRGKRVVTYGQPFYAGWGLTDDRMAGAPALVRRKRRLGLDDLVAGALLRYPIYWDWELRGYTTCEAVLVRILETRSSAEADGSLHKLRAGFARRQFRKLQALTRAWRTA